MNDPRTQCPDRADGLSGTPVRTPGQDTPSLGGVRVRDRGAPREEKSGHRGLTIDALVEARDPRALARRLAERRRDPEGRDPEPRQGARPLDLEAAAPHRPACLRGQRRLLASLTHAR